MSGEQPTIETKTPPWVPWLRFGLALLLVLVSLVRVGRIEVFEDMERALYDFATVHLIPPAPVSGKVALVFVDDASLEAIGERWPLERATWARFIAEMAAFRPSALAIDAVFDQAGPREALDLAEQLMESLDSPEFQDSTPARALSSDLRFRLKALDGDRQLVEAVAQQGGTVLGEYFVLDDGSAPAARYEPPPEGPGPQPLGPSVATRLQATQLVGNIEPAEVAARSTGAINILHDPDGVVHRYPYAVGWAESRFPSLALATVRTATADDATREELTRAALDRDRATPLLRFPPQDAIPMLRFADVLLDEGRSDSLGTLLGDRLVFVGVSATGLHDSHVRPGGQRIPGVLLQAIAADNLLTGTSLASEGRAAWIGFIETALLLLAFAYFARFFSAQRSLVGFGVVAMGAHAALSLYVLPLAGYWSGAAPVFVGLFSVTGAELVGRSIALQRQRRELLIRQQVVETILRSREHIKLIVDNVADAILSLDSDGDIVSANGAARSLFGFDSTVPLLGGIGTVLPGWPGTDARIEQTAAIWECEGVRADGTTFAAEVITSRIPPQPEAGPMSASFISVVRDITARREADSAKQRFVSMVSHELRTPVTSIRGALGLVASGRLGDISPDAARMIEVAHNGSQRLVRLVNDILDVARIDAGALSVALQPLELGEAVSDAVAEAQGFAAEHKVPLLLEPAGVDLPVNGDRDRIAQVLANLVSNALKFSPEGVAVTVSLEHRQHVARVSVRDRGPGIPVEARARIFERFAQAHTATQRTRGTGLGLGIARSIVELHGGSIGFETAVGQGTTFWFELPLTPPTASDS
ncbi:MAG: CHASE2 domain-containing protein [Myxococcota bacterium]